MFGTLVVSLPSTHTGGEVILKHCGETVIYKSSKSRASCAGWYSDVTHEVRPVTSGYRWVLTYNLAIDRSLPAPSAGLQRSELRPASSLHQAMARRGFRAPKPICIPRTGPRVYRSQHFLRRTERSGSCSCWCAPPSLQRLASHAVPRTDREGGDGRC